MSKMKVWILRKRDLIIGFVWSNISETEERQCASIKDIKNYIVTAESFPC